MQWKSDKDSRGQCPICGAMKFWGSAAVDEPCGECAEAAEDCRAWDKRDGAA